MKGSDFGYPKPSSVGKWAYANCEDGDGDGAWCFHADDREDAIAELKNRREEDGEEFHGFIVELLEADIDGPDAERVLEDVSEWVYENVGEVADGWPRASKDDVRDLQRRLDKAFGEWLTDRKLWPSWTMIGVVEEVG
jgi:hypothetical protein